MISQKKHQNYGIGRKIIVFMLISSLVGLGLATRTLAGSAGMALKTHSQVLEAGGTEGSCPQPRKTRSAPGGIAKAGIPASANAEAGQTIFQKTAKPMACKMCHGDGGAGNGKLGKVLTPRPRNFTCSATMNDVSPGQMFWIIKNGSKNTGMVAHGKRLNDQQIWDVVKYIDTQFIKRK